MMIAAGKRDPDLGFRLHQQHEGDRHHQLVGHRIEESAERRDLLQSTGEIAVDPVGEGGEREGDGAYLFRPRHREVEHDHEDGDQRDAEQSERDRNVHSRVSQAFVDGSGQPRTDAANARKVLDPCPSHPRETTELRQQSLAKHRPDTRKRFEGRRPATLVALRTMSGDREPMRLVTDPLDEVQRRRVFRQPERRRTSRPVDRLEARLSARAPSRPRRARRRSDRAPRARRTRARAARDRPSTRRTSGSTGTSGDSISRLEEEKRRVSAWCIAA